MCLECYSEFSRITPIIEPEKCLESHLQYVCQTCGRIICANRGKFPFKSLEIAKLYLRPIEAQKGKQCGVYELQAHYTKMTKGQKSRKVYKIFSDRKELEAYIKRSPNKTAVSKQPKFTANTYIPCSEDPIRKLDSAEIERYLLEKEGQAEEWRDFLNQYID
jgi:hypothetical protein